MRIVLLASLLVLAACNPLDRVPEPTAPPGSAAFFEEQRAICEARGGTFVDSESRPTKICFVTPKDAGEGCSQRSDCEGECLARSRSCAPVIPLVGCHEVLMSGGMPATVCLQ
ncbi:hypothetical protein R3X27_16185 [Tropicimonas sp. TH_r6]|uniref:hypothetical protein n=1 Tax=Tropicimonas sp. TH_r6 TaxID=3082085 RepID=UPI002954C86E|nr:hypothetical protein [Tropicimonas sp. TH_r6]MDV7144225.1 hypothetical protein [Tropicimonas sp. TH_r6]